MKKWRNSDGFTLLELLTVVVIIGVLAAIAIAKFTNTRERSQMAVMQSDLRNVATAQESYFADYAGYTSTVANLDYNISESVTLSIPVATTSGWRATSSHASVTGRECELYYGSASGASTATSEGTVMCS